MLENDTNQISVEHSIGHVIFEGKEFVDACTCWQGRAAKIMAFIDSHDNSISRYLNLRSEKLINKAKQIRVSD